MTETIAVYLIGGTALVLSARWIYQTAAGKKQTSGCGCDRVSCPATESSDLSGQSECIDMQQFEEKKFLENRDD